MAKVGFCAVSGSGMSALAQISKYMGNDVYGSDRSFDQGKDQHNKLALENVGIKIFPQDGSMLDSDFNVLYASTAVEDTIPDIKKARELNIPVKRRSDLLAEIFASYLDCAGKNPLVINGALLKNYEKRPGIPNVVLNNGRCCVIEADESDGSIEKYTPYIAVINNISLDHKPINELQTLFGDFARRAVKGAVINLDNINSRNLPGLAPKTVTFGITDPNADLFAENITAVSDGTAYVFRGKNYKLNLIGAFNVANAMCAAAACSLLDIQPEVSCKILEGFLGTKRRLEVLGQACNITVIDDFAHNPDKVNASMSALKSYSGRLLIMFQPHGFSPMRMMGKEIMDAFASHMDKEDILMLPEIFFAGGTVKRDISSLDLVKYAQTAGAGALYFSTRSELKEHLLKSARPGDRIVLMGARDNSITDLGYEILEKLK